jgi:hypothetical protein
MPQLTAETIRRMARELYGYEMSEPDAAATANTAGAVLALATHLRALGLDGVEMPFGYPNLFAEAERLARQKPGP